MGYVLPFAVPILLLLVLALPLFVVAWRRQRRQAARSFMVSAGLVGVLCGVITLTSRRQVAQCLQAGNSDCIDSGAIGLQLVMVAFYALFAWLAAFSISKD